MMQRQAISGGAQNRCIQVIISDCPGAPDGVCFLQTSVRIVDAGQGVRQSHTQADATVEATPYIAPWFSLTLAIGVCIVFAVAVTASSGTLQQHGRSSLHEDVSNRCQWLSEVFGLFISFSVASGAAFQWETFIMDKEYKAGMYPSITFLSFAKNACITLIGGAWLWCTRSRSSGGALADGMEQAKWLNWLQWVKWLFVLGLLRSLSAWLDYSLVAVTPMGMQAIANSLLLLPMLLFTWWICGWPISWFGQPCSWADGFSALAMTVILTMLAIELAPPDRLHRRCTLLAYALLLARTTCEAVNVAGLGRSLTRFPERSVFEMLVALSGFGALYGLVSVHFNIGFSIMFQFQVEAPLALCHLLAFTCCCLAKSMVQLHTLSHHGPFVYGLILTSYEATGLLFTTIVYNRSSFHLWVGLASLPALLFLRPFSDACTRRRRPLAFGPTDTAPVSPA